jgi:hypothetical protein
LPYGRYFTPSAPGMPQVIDIDSQEISLAWLRPDHDGSAGPVVGYRVKMMKKNILKNHN